jgi:hypothetical protein
MTRTESRLVPEFLALHPTVEGYTLICVCEEINRITKAGIGVHGILERALALPSAADYLVRVCERFQNQKQ